MTATAERFVRRTTLQADEYRKNFRQIDRDVIEVLKSAEAKSVTRLMGTLYLTLIDAPTEYWEREGVLRFTGDVREGKPCTAWQQLVALLDCGNSTAQKALEWMHRQGIIGYFAGKNGVGIRIFINRAAASIGRREQQKNLRLVPTPAIESRTPTIGTPFKDCSLEIEDTNKEFRAPKNGADITTLTENSPDQPASTLEAPRQTALLPEEKVEPVSTNDVSTVIPAHIVAQLRDVLEPQLRSIAAQAAASASAREHERTRQWLDQYGLPKAARVAQREAYNIFKHQSVKIDSAERARADLQVGRNVSEYTPPQARSLSPEEIAETAAICVALLEVQGKGIDVTLSEISAEAGGWLLPEVMPRVREAAHALLNKRSERRS